MSKAAKKREVDAHNRRFEHQQQEKLALEIMRVEGLKTRDHEAALLRKKREAKNARNILLMGIGLSLAANNRVNPRGE